MTHKTSPKLLRIKKIDDWLTKTFLEKNFDKVLKEDFMIRDFIQKKLDPLYIEKIEIERLPEKLIVSIFTSRPGLIIGRKGEGIEKLANEIEEKILKTKGKLKVEVKEVPNPWASAVLIAKWVANQIEKRVPYRRALKAALAKAAIQREVKGVRIQVKGRLDGVTIARKEWMQIGRLPRQTLRADIDYGEATAFCSYGTIGVKVWIFKGEKLE